MSRDGRNVVPLGDHTNKNRNGNGNGGGRDNTGERLARLETEVKHLATKEDVEKVNTNVEKANTNVASLSGKVTAIMWIVGILAMAIIGFITSTLGTGIRPT